jgi:hypothetical protein
MNHGDPDHSRCDAPEEAFEFPQEMTDCRFTVGSIVWVRQVSCFVVVVLFLLVLLLVLLSVVVLLLCFVVVVVIAFGFGVVF